MMSDNDTTPDGQTGLTAYTTPNGTTHDTDTVENPEAAGLATLLQSLQPGAPNSTEEQGRIEDHVETIEEMLEHVAAQGHTRSRVFTDWIDMILASLQGDDDTYQDTVDAYTDTRFETGDQRHPVTQLSHAFGELIDASNTATRDVLGDVYMSFGAPSDDLGQNFTPAAVADMMAASTLDTDSNTSSNTDSPDADAGTEGTAGEDPESEAGPLPGLQGTSIADPACGSGRLLLSMARSLRSETPDQSFWVYGCDLDPVCAKMTVVNLYLHGIDGVIEHGDALTQETHAAWVVQHNDDESGSSVMEIPADAVTPDITL